MQTLYALAPLIALAFSAFNLVYGLVIWAARKSFASTTAVDAAKDRANHAHHRLDLLEERLKQVPTDAAIDALRDDVSNLRTDMRENSVRVETAVLGVKRIEDFLLGSKHG